MNIEVTNNAKDVKVTVNKNADGTFAILIVEDQKRRLGDIKPGSVVILGKSGRRYIVLGHGAETTALVTEKFAKKIEYGEDSNYVTSDVRKYCTGDFYKELCGDVGAENIVKHTVNLVADDGTGKGNVVQDYVSIMTTELYRRYREFLPRYGDWWWTATRVTHDDSLGYSRGVCYVNSRGVLNWYDCDYTYGVRPFCVLDSSVSVLEVEECNG